MIESKIFFKRQPPNFVDSITFTHFTDMLTLSVVADADRTEKVHQKLTEFLSIIDSLCSYVIAAIRSSL